MSYNTVDHEFYVNESRNIFNKISVNRNQCKIRYCTDLMMKVPNRG